MTAEPDVTVVDGVRVLRSASDARARRIQARRGCIYAGLAVWAFTQAVTAYPVPNVLAGVLFAEFAVLLLRRRAFLTGYVFDEELARRVGQPLLELCARARTGPPLVAFRADRARCAYVQPRSRGGLVLVLSAPYVQAVDDRRLRALLAHELVHVARGHVGRYRNLAVAVSLAAGGVAALAAMVIAALGLYALFPATLAAVTAWNVLLAILVGLLRRRSEVQADREGAALCGDPDALAGALVEAYSMSGAERARMLGPAPLRWFLAPVSWRMPTHPSLAKRLALLEKGQA